MTIAYVPPSDDQQTAQLEEREDMIAKRTQEQQRQELAEKAAIELQIRQQFEAQRQQEDQQLTQQQQNDTPANDPTQVLKGFMGGVLTLEIVASTAEGLSQGAPDGHGAELNINTPENNLFQVPGINTPGMMS